MLDRADSLMQTHPDSALALLDAAGNQEAKESGSQGVRKSSLSMRYRLLRVKAEDKLYKPITGYESLVIDTLLPYFQRHGDSHRLSTALFYAGRICADKGDAPQAIDYYQQTLDALPEGEDPCFRGLIHIQIGWLLHYQNLYPEAILQFKEACRYEKEAKDTTYIIHILESIGEDYMLQQKNDSALMYLHQAIDLAEQSKNHSMWIKVMMETARFYLFQDSIQSARNCLMPVLADYDSSDISPVYVNAAMLYYKENNVDSTLYFCRGLLEKGTVYAKYTAYKALAAMSLQGRNSKEALQYQNKWEECDDSIRKLESRNTIARMHSLYNYQLREKETQKVTEANHTLTTQLFSLIIVFTIVVALLSYFYQRKRMQGMKQKERIQELLQGIHEKDRQEERREKESAFQSSDIYRLVFRKLSQQDESPMRQEDWVMLEQALNETYDNFAIRLKELHPMNPVELHVSMLLKMGLKPKEISRLCFLTLSGVSNTRRRLVEKVTNKSGKAEMWDMLVHRL